MNIGSVRYPASEGKCKRALPAEGKCKRVLPTGEKRSTGSRCILHAMTNRAEPLPEHQHGFAVSESGRILRAQHCIRKNRSIGSNGKHIPCAAFRYKHMMSTAYSVQRGWGWVAACANGRVLKKQTCKLTGETEPESKAGQKIPEIPGQIFIPSLILPMRLTPPFCRDKSKSIRSGRQSVIAFQQLFFCRDL